MKTIAGVLLISFFFTLIWVGAAFIGVSIVFRAMGDSTFVEYLRMGTAWFVCPAIGGYYAPQVTNGILDGLEIDSVVASFLTLLTIIFILIFGFSVWSYGTKFGGSVWEMVQLSLQYTSMVAGTLIGKWVVKSNF